MARKPETTFINSVHAHLLRHEDGGPYRMKNHNEYVGGIADCWYSGKSGDAWVEYKYITHIPKSNNIKLGITELQREWLNDRWDEGRRVFVVLGLKKGGIVFEQKEWNKTFDQATLCRRIVSRKEIAEWISILTMGVYESPSKPSKSGSRLKRCV